ncbi:hypothetical protein DICVIV_01441 [Dictyocaulus viviparus]|uniref:Uncharacterized protein n=1 Tax=Dictyocaulus viviparus TaxID=29172 RepID=A0A0D8Y8P2_DICVI|nr:hypothetical protein DICVIV_01441 [Dictyocaulus viviparus]
MDAQSGGNVGNYVKETLKDVTQYNDIVEERARELATNPIFRKKENTTARREAFFKGRVGVGQFRTHEDKQQELCRAQLRNVSTMPTSTTATESVMKKSASARNLTVPLSTSIQNRDITSDSCAIKSETICKPTKKQMCTPTLRITRRSIEQYNQMHNKNPLETKSLPISLHKSSQPTMKPTGINIRKTKEKQINKPQEGGVNKSEPWAETYEDDKSPLCDLADINPSPRRRNEPRRYSSYFDLHKKSSDFNLHEPSASKTLDVMQKQSSRRKGSKLKKKDHSKKHSSDQRSHRKKSRSARLRSRKSRRLSTNRRSALISANEPKDLMPSENAVEPTPLAGPISVDSIRKLKKSGEQLNLIQVYRIYGSGAVEQAYENLPRRSAAKWARGAMASVKYGRNMVEITLINTDIQASKRGRSNKWIFIKDMGHKTLPILFGKTVLVKTHSPAPFCLSITAPFYVSAHQEQNASPDGGDRFRESIELRSCQDSGMPSYEMKPLHDPNHPIFNEHIFLGKGLVRIDSVSNIPNDQKLEALLSQPNSLTVTRQYRIELPWRQRDSSVSSEIPRAPQIKDIHPTSPFKNIPKHKEDTLTPPIVEKPIGSKMDTFHGRRIAPPLNQDVYGFNINQPENQESSKNRRRRSQKSCSTSQSSTFSPSSKSGEDISSINNRVFARPPKDTLTSDSTATTKSPAGISSREMILLEKHSEIGHEKKKRVNLPGLRIKNRKEPPTLKRYEPNRPKPTTKSDTEAEKSIDKKSKESKPVEKDFSSSPDLSDYSPRAEKDEVVGEVVKIEVVKTPPGMRTKHEPPVKKGISYKFHHSKKDAKRSKSLKKNKQKKKSTDERQPVSPDVKSDTRQLPPDHSPLKTLLTAKELLGNNNIDNVAVHGKLPDGTLKLEMQLSSKLNNPCKLTTKSPYQSDHNLTT